MTSPIQFESGHKQDRRPSTSGETTATDVETIDDLPHDRSTRDACVMMVDDQILNIDIVQAYLEEEGFHNFAVTTESVTALDTIRERRPDILLLDINMPRVNGLDILRAMRKDVELRLIPVIVLTAATDPETKLKALRLGASDFLSKPVDPSELILRLENVVAAKTLRDHLTDYSARLEQQVEIRTRELVRSRQEAIHCLARAAEYRDDDTGQHVIRVGRYAGIIARQLGLPEPAVELIEQAAQLHDIGKIGIPDSVLHKPGRLDDGEFELIKTHCDIGRQIIDPLTEKEKRVLGKHTIMGSIIMSTGCSSPVLRLGSVIAETHHERWDGSGYPQRLVGAEIPLEGRIVAVADVFDALGSNRPYKTAFPLEKCFAIIEEGRGKHFDPRILNAFFAGKQQIISVYRECQDFPVDLEKASQPTKTACAQ